MSRRPSHTSPSKGPTQRQLRVAEEIRHILADILRRGELRDPLLSGTPITISEVRISPDLKNATAFCMPLGGQNRKEVLAALNRCRAFVRGQIGGRLNLRYTPDVRFQEDETFEEAERVDRLLQTDKVRRDLKSHRPDEDDD